MHRYWTPLVEPICDVLKPRTITEIGAATGLNTKKILEYCQRTGAHAHIVDPEPIGNHDEIRPLVDAVATVHETTSHEALPGLKTDMYIVDGDHNWFTVFHDMRGIEANFDAASEPMPVIIAHDVAWPYGRRDMYYAPERIPPEARQPYARRGIRFGESELVVDGGYNYRHDNALHEGGKRNGVLTAIEDFMEESSVPWKLTTFPIFHGLAVLHVPDRMEASVRDELEKLLHVPPSVRKQLEGVEKERDLLITELVENHRALGGRPGPRVAKFVRTVRRIVNKFR